ncbi:AtpZ/AtpI family protein [Aurantibacter sp.]|uniref:AtpZ/AtpI family protein n=1 Tax=Aurantibacter sp. TaxID=2807103 RepID=UPI0035C86B11
MAEKPKKQLNKFIRFTSIGLQMGLTIYLGSKLGEWLDVKFNNQDQLYYKIASMLAVFIAIGSVIFQVLKITNNDNKNSK